MDRQNCSLLYFAPVSFFFENNNLIKDYNVQQDKLIQTKTKKNRMCKKETTEKQYKRKKNKYTVEKEKRNI